MLPLNQTIGTLLRLSENATAVWHLENKLIPPPPQNLITPLGSHVDFRGDKINSQVIHVPGINDRLHLYPRFQWAALRGPEPRHEGESEGGMKTSAESLLITISNARRARQTREGQPQNRGVGGKGGGRAAEWALVCAGTDPEKTKRT